EIHCDFVNKGVKYTPFASLPNKAVVNNSITFKAASKSFGLAAMKCAWFFSDNMDYINRVKANNRADLTTMGMIASKAAYAGGEDWLNQCVEYIDGNHDFVEKFIHANIPMIKHVKPQGTYLTWLDISAVANKINAKALAAEANKAAAANPVTPETMVERYLVKTAKVHLNQGASYGAGGENHMRMNIATSRKTLEVALNNLANALRGGIGSAAMGWGFDGRRGGPACPPRADTQVGPYTCSPSFRCAMKSDAFSRRGFLHTAGAGAMGAWLPRTARVREAEESVVGVSK